MTTTLIGLAGLRGTGKSEIAKCLVRDHGFQRLHPFDGGKAACSGYFRHLGASEDEAERMINGDLKDRASPYLPDSQTPRFFMEKLGKFMGVSLGPDWTIGREIERAQREGSGDRFVIESIVYEADVLKQKGGIIVMVERSESTIVGIDTDAATLQIQPDYHFTNNGSCLEDLSGHVGHLLEYISRDMNLIDTPSC